MDFLHYKNNTSNRDVISLFSGAMGLDIGLAKAGLNIVIGQDFDPACVATMQMDTRYWAEISEKLMPQICLNKLGLHKENLSSFAADRLASRFPLPESGWESMIPVEACSWILSG